MKPTTHRIIFEARLNRLRLCRGRRHTKAAAIMAARLKASPHELRRAWYRDGIKVPLKTDEPFEVI